MNGAHPRVCGENANSFWTLVISSGSSPRVRGKQMREEVTGIPPGLIPACAGKTGTCSLEAWPSEAHPRVCGENGVLSWSGLVSKGSSPRVRGKLVCSWHGVDVRRLIPACAGKTISSLGFIVCFPAHPRVCGENSTSGPKSIDAGGSSPRVRGKHNRCCSEGGGVGLIPACAGKTLNDLEF